MRKTVVSSPEYFAEQVQKSGRWFGDDLSDIDISPEILKVVNKAVVERFHVVPVRVDKEPKKVYLVTCSVQGFHNSKRLAEMVGSAIELKMASKQNISKAVLKYYGLSLSELLLERVDESSERDEDSFDKLSEEKRSPVVENVERILADAIQQGASDILILPHSNGSFVQFKVDGRLINVSEDHEIKKDQRNIVVNIIKIMADMNTASKSMPDDGSFNRNMNGTMVDCRVSTMPTVRGEKVVIRLLPTSRTVMNFPQLGFNEREIDLMLSALEVPSGLFLVAGPTGSGKSTTLYAGIETFGGLNYNTITIENPVEIKDEFLTQVQVREDSSDEEMRLTAEKILKSTMRQAPDNILFGEIRDGREGGICIEAAQTGHRVLSTVHANDVITALIRLFNMGIDRSALLTNLNCIVAQRLVAVLCPKCSKEFIPSVNRYLKEKDVAILKSGTPMQTGNGCYYCSNHGYHGRTVISEIIRFDNQLRDFYLQKERGITEQIQFLTEHYGYRSLRDSAVGLMKVGKLSLEEFKRVIGN